MINITRRNFLLATYGLCNLIASGSHANESAYDVVIVGAGLAGLTCGCIAIELGARSVLILEKEPIIGGTSAITNGFWTVGGTDLQKQLGIKDSDQAFYNDMIRIGGGANKENLVKVFVQANHQQYNWVLRHGLSPKSIVFAEGIQRAHLFDVPSLIELHRKYFINNGGTLFTSSKAIDLVVNPSNVVKGVIYTKAHELNFVQSRYGVLLATGGFSRNKELIKKYAPSLRKAEVIAAEGATGDGLEMASKVGAIIEDTEHLKASYGFVRNPSSMDDLSLIQYSGAIIVNQKGVRFVNESLPYKELAEKALAQAGNETFAIFDESIRRNAIKQPPDSLIWDKEKRAIEDIAYVGLTLTEAAEKAGLNGDILSRTVAEYNFNIENKKLDPFGRSGLPGSNKPRPLIPIKDKPFYIFPTTPAIIGTYCGLRVDEQSRVINRTTLLPVPGLWAAGEIMGGIHGASFIMGSALAKAAAFGRIAAHSMLGRSWHD